MREDLQNKYAKGRLGHLKKNNALTSLNWMCTIATTVFGGGGGFSLYFLPRSWYGTGCFTIAVAILIFYGCVYVYWMVKDPDRLQTEEYNLKTLELGLLSNSEKNKEVTIVNQSGNLLEANVNDTKTHTKKDHT